MSLGTLEAGMVIPMNSFTANYDTLNLSYRRPPKKGQYAFLLLGIGRAEAPIDVNIVMNELGWTYDPAAANKQLAERKKEKAG